MEKVISPEEFKNKMQEIDNKFGGDEECCHSLMDGLLCDVLESLGYGDGVKIFVDSPKWYS